MKNQNAAVSAVSDEAMDELAGGVHLSPKIYPIKLIKQKDSSLSQLKEQEEFQTGGTWGGPTDEAVHC